VQTRVYPIARWCAKNRRDEPALEEREPGHFVACPVVS